MLRLPLSAAGLLLGGCALLPSAWRPAPLPPPPLLAPAALGGAHTATQVLHLVNGERSFTLQCALQADADAVTLVAVGAMGQRLFSLRYDGARLDAQAGPYAPRAMPPERVLSDVQLALWPLAAWQEKLRGSDWSVAEPVPGVRELRFRRRLVAKVDYDGPDAWGARIRLQNFALGYSIGIEPQMP